MKKLTIYHNGDCSKSRATLEIIESSGREFEVINYLVSPPTAAELDTLLTQLGLSPEQITRDHEDRFSELRLDRNPPKTRAEWIGILVQNPILIERPIITDGKRAVIGRPPENVRTLIDP